MRPIIKIGVMGCANIAERMMLPAMLRHPGYHLKLVASRDTAKAKAFAQMFQCESVQGYQRLLDQDLDAVYIPLPTGMHSEWVLKSIKAGKHVLVEKSAATSLLEVQQMVEAAKKHQVLLMENFQFQYHSQHQFIKRLLEEDTIGEIRCFRSSFGFPPFPNKNNIRYSKELGGGALLDAGAYTLKAISFMIGNGFSVEAASLNYLPGFEVDIFGAGMLVNNSGIAAQVAFGFDQYYQCNYEIWGSKGKLVSKRAFTAGPSINPQVILEKQDEVKEFDLEADDHFYNILEHFRISTIEGEFEHEYYKLLEQSRLIHEFKDKTDG